MIGVQMMSDAWKERQARRIHAAAIWLGKKLGRIMTRLGLD